MIWGAVLEPGRLYTETMLEETQLSFASLESRSEHGDKENNYCHIIMKTSKAEYLLCTLVHGSIYQQSLDLKIMPREKVTFSVQGSSVVYLMGYSSSYPEEEEGDDEQDFIDSQDAIADETGWETISNSEIPIRVMKEEPQDIIEDIFPDDEQSEQEVTEVNRQDEEDEDSAEEQVIVVAEDNESFVKEEGEDKVTEILDENEHVEDAAEIARPTPSPTPMPESYGRLDPLTRKKMPAGQSAMVQHEMQQSAEMVLEDTSGQLISMEPTVTELSIESVGRQPVQQQQHVVVHSLPLASHRRSMQATHRHAAQRQHVQRQAILRQTGGRQLGSGQFRTASHFKTAGQFRSAGQLRTGGQFRIGGQLRTGGQFRSGGQLRHGRQGSNVQRQNFRGHHQVRQPVRVEPVHAQSMTGQSVQSMHGQSLQAMPGQNVQTLPGQNLQTLPGQNVQTLSGQNVQTLSGQNVQQTLSGQNVQTLPGQNVQSMPGQNMQAFTVSYTRQIETGQSGLEQTGPLSSGMIQTDDNLGMHTGIIQSGSHTEVGMEDVPGPSTSGLQLPLECLRIPRFPFSESSTSKTEKDGTNLSSHLSIQPGSSLPLEQRSHPVSDNVIHPQNRIREMNTCRTLPNQCRYCLVTYPDMLTLKAHEISHSEPKRFSCQFCPKRFANSRDTMRHERIHTGFKPFKCRYCYKCFSRRDKWKEHEIQHTGILPFFCQYCGKGFTKRWACKAHEKVHL